MTHRAVIKLSFRRRTWASNLVLPLTAATSCLGAFALEANASPLRPDPATDLYRVLPREFGDAVEMVARTEHDRGFVGTEHPEFDLAAECVDPTACDLTGFCIPGLDTCFGAPDCACQTVTDELDADPFGVPNVEAFGVDVVVFPAPLTLFPGTPAEKVVEWGCFGASPVVQFKEGPPPANPVPALDCADLVSTGLEDLSRSTNHDWTFAGLWTFSLAFAGPASFQSFVPCGDDGLHSAPPRIETRRAGSLFEVQWTELCEVPDPSLPGVDWNSIRPTVRMRFDLAATTEVDFFSLIVDDQTTTHFTGFSREFVSQIRFAGAASVYTLCSLAEDCADIGPGLEGTGFSGIARQWVPSASVPADEARFYVTGPGFPLPHLFAVDTTLPFTARADMRALGFVSGGLYSFHALSCVAGNCPADVRNRGRATTVVYVNNPPHVTATAVVSAPGVPVSGNATGMVLLEATVADVDSTLPGTAQVSMFPGYTLATAIQADAGAVPPWLANETFAPAADFEAGGDCWAGDDPTDGSSRAAFGCTSEYAPNVTRVLAGDAIIDVDLTGLAPGDTRTFTAPGGHVVTVRYVRADRSGGVANAHIMQINYSGPAAGETTLEVRRHAHTAGSFRAHRESFIITRDGDPGQRVHFAGIESVLAQPDPLALMALIASEERDNARTPDTTGIDSAGVVTMKIEVGALPAVLVITATDAVPLNGTGGDFSTFEAWLDALLEPTGLKAGLTPRHCEFLVDDTDGDTQFELANVDADRPAVVPAADGTCRLAYDAASAVGSFASFQVTPSDGLDEGDPAEHSFGVGVCPACDPLAAERCDGCDNNCDGLVDEGFDVGAACTVGLGACAAQGHRVCSADGLTASCDAVPGTASEEICDGLDNDCDGQADDGNPSAGAPCSTGLLGVCAAGTLTCANGTPVCVGTFAPGAESETCDGLDNDCDGQADEGFGAGEQCVVEVPEVPCGGVAGVKVCVAGSGLVCQPVIAPGGGFIGVPTPEVCDGRDNDCDGAVDEDTGGGTCATGLPGACATGTRECVNGALVCLGPRPGPETCDGTDEDCDGVVDNGTGGGPCDTGQPGACAAGTVQCLGGAATCVAPPSCSNACPVADAGSDRVVECQAAGSALVTLDGTGSSDDDGDALTYHWTVGEALIAQGAQPAVSFGIGVHAVSLDVGDGECSDGDEATVTVSDTVPPAVSSAGTSLWPPNHKYRTIDVTRDCGVVIEDACEGAIAPPAASVGITCVTSDEPEDGTGDGHTRNDIVIRDATRVQVRAERRGTGNGRVYTIHFTAPDGSGNTASATCQVGVPHDQGRCRSGGGSVAVDDGPVYEVCR